MPWAVTESIALELDHALSLSSGFHHLASLTTEDASLVSAVPADWRQGWRNMLGDPRSSVNILEMAAHLAGVLMDGQYERALMSVRKMTTEDALTSISAASAAFGLAPDDSLETPSRLEDLASRLMRAVYAAHDLPIAPGSELDSSLAQDTRVLPLILAEGRLHDEFWQWLDRFYYESYKPWRNQRQGYVEELLAKSTLALGARQGDTSPDMSWLGPHNPLLRYHEIGDSVRSATLDVVFWAEPFGLADSWTLLPGVFAMSFADPGARFEHFREAADDLARRLGALSDPTRLVVLRLIRNFGMINTEIAEYLGLSRPTVSIHAKALREAGLISSRQEGRETKHQVDLAGMARVVDDLAKFLGLEHHQPQE